MASRPAVLVACFAIAALAARAAGAAPSPADRALATELFNQGRDELASGELASACPKLEESQRLDPGGGTLLNVAKCHEQQGRTASAWTEYTEALAIAEREGQSERVAFASERIAVLASKLSHLIVLVPPESDRPELVVLRDGTPVARAAWGSKMPIDPGPHVVVASAEGFRSWSTEIEVGPDADRDEVTLPPLERLPPAPAMPAPVAPDPAIVLPPPIPAPAERAMPPGRIAGWSVASVGFAMLGAAAAAGVVTIVKDGESDQLCEPRCDQDGYDLNQQAKMAADASTALFVIGAVAAGVGVTIVLLTPTPAKPAVALVTRPGTAGFLIRF